VLQKQIYDEVLAKLDWNRISHDRFVDVENACVVHPSTDYTGPLSCVHYQVLRS
jgi:hypothetical protein